MEQYFIGWLAVFLIVSTAEALTQQLVAIWFSVGSFIAIFVSILGFDFSIQLAVFLIVSIVSILAFRPIMMKHFKVKISKTNIALVVGKKGYVLTDFNALTFEGRVQVDGMDWAASSKNEVLLKKGDKIVVEGVQGVKLIVRNED